MYAEQHHEKNILHFLQPSIIAKASPCKETARIIDTSTSFVYTKNINDEWKRAQQQQINTAASTTLTTAAYTALERSRPRKRSTTAGLFLPVHSLSKLQHLVFFLWVVLLGSFSHTLPSSVSAFKLSRYHQRSPISSNFQLFQVSSSSFSSSTPPPTTPTATSSTTTKSAQVGRTAKNNKYTNKMMMMMRLGKKATASARLNEIRSISSIHVCPSLASYHSTGTRTSTLTRGSMSMSGALTARRYNLLHRYHSTINPPLPNSLSSFHAKSFSLFAHRSRSAALFSSTAAAVAGGGDETNDKNIEDNTEHNNHNKNENTVAATFELRDLQETELEQQQQQHLEFVESGFNKLGLSQELVRALKAQGITEPTPVQSSTIPRLLNRENLVLAASTGSGKTLAYTLPAIQSMAAQEQQFGYQRQENRPRCLILVPTRELARQVLTDVKKMGHYSKISSCAVLGGEPYGIQKKTLARKVDLVVASPGRLMQHKQQGNVFFSQVNTVVIDEVDTMLTQGFGADIRAILRAVLSRPLRSSIPKTPDSVPNSTQIPTHNMYDGVQLIMATATLTKAVRALLSDVSGEGEGKTDKIAGKTGKIGKKDTKEEGKQGTKQGGGALNIEYSDPSNATPRKAESGDTRVSLKIVEVDGLHRSLPQVRHVMEETKGVDKIVLLKNILRNKALSSTKGVNKRTLVFCNTIDSCRAVEFALKDDTSFTGSKLGDYDDNLGEKDKKSSNSVVLSYHGDLNSRERERNLEIFRASTPIDDANSASLSGNGGHKLGKYMVCTDIAARGLDIPEIDHVVMFDFPLNPIDYLHRSGRCGRAGRKGIVTSLISKRDQVLSTAIQNAIKLGQPLDSLSSDKRDYLPKPSKSSTKKTIKPGNFGRTASTSTSSAAAGKGRGNGSSRAKSSGFDGKRGGPLGGRGGRGGAGREGGRAERGGEVAGIDVGWSIKNSKTGKSARRY